MVPGWFYSSEALLRAYVGTVAQLETLVRGLAQEEPCHDKSESPNPFEMVEAGD